MVSNVPPNLSALKKQAFFNACGQGCGLTWRPDWWGIASPLAHEAVGLRPSPHGPFHRSELQHGSWLPPGRAIQGVTRKHRDGSHSLSVTYIPSLPLYSACWKQVTGSSWNSRGGDCTSWWMPGGKDHLGHFAGCPGHCCLRQELFISWGKRRESKIPANLFLPYYSGSFGWRRGRLLLLFCQRCENPQGRETGKEGSLLNHKFYKQSSDLMEG